VQEIKCIECGAIGHRAKDCPNAAGTAKKHAQDYFKEGRCLICGEIGHAAKHCPTVGGNPEEGKPIAPRHERMSLEERNANKVCMQCGQKGHVMRDCPINPSTVKIKGIRQRYSGSRLQKMLPETLKDTKGLEPAHEIFSSAVPMVGVVVSTSAQKTIGVLIQRTVTHPRLKISLDRSKKLLVHDDTERAVCGDIVLIQQTRPISKNKHFALKKVVMTLNDRKETMAKRVEEGKKVYAQINEDAVAKLEKLREQHASRQVELKKKEIETLQAAKQRLQAEMNERMKDVISVVDEASKEAAKRNEEWLKQMKRKLETKDEWVKLMEAGESALKPKENK
jgi:small subunit ribosomal protein S17